MATRDWLAGWSPGYSRVLAQVETANARAALVDTNGDGRELWFGLDVIGPSGGWYTALDWEDVDPHQPVGRAGGVDVIFGWGTDEPRRRRVIDFDGVPYPVHVSYDGWWLLIVANTGLAASE